MSITVREGQKVWPTCPECGCRFELFNMEEWTLCTHYTGSAKDTDARGHICSLVNSKIWLESTRVEHIIGV